MIHQFVRALLFSIVIFLSACTGINTTNPADEIEINTLYSTLSNIHVVNYKGVYFMVDAGVDGDQEKVVNQLNAIDINPAQISFIVLTHGHPDHAGVAAYFQQNYGTKIIAGKNDQALLKSGEIDSLCPTSILGNLIYFLVPEKFQSFEPDLLIDQPYNLLEYGIDGTIYPIPSHTEGSLAVVIEDVAFVGDIIRGKAMAKTTPALHFYQCDLARNEQVIYQALAWDASIWYTGHFGPLKPERVKKWLNSNPFDS